MPAIPLYQLGKHLISLTVDGATVGASGTLTAAGSPVQVSSKFKSFGLDLSPEKAEINTSNSVRHNNVVLADGWSLDLSVLKVNDATDPSPLRTLCLAYEYLKIVIQTGTGASARTITLWGSRGAYSEGIEGRGEQIANLRIDSADVGATDFFAVS